MLNLCFSSFIKWDSNADFPILDISLPEMTQGSVLGLLFSKRPASPASHSHLPHLITQAQTESLYLRSFPAWKTLVSSRSILSTASPVFTLGSLRHLRMEFHPFPQPNLLSPQMPLPLESPGKIPLGARNLEGKSLGTTIGIPLMLHFKELCPGGFNDNASSASWSCLRENFCQLLSA